MMKTTKFRGKLLLLTLFVLVAGIMISVFSFQKVNQTDTGFPALQLPQAANQSGVKDLMNLDSIEIEPDATAAVYKLKTVNAAQEQEKIKKALHIRRDAVFGTLSDPASISQTQYIGYDDLSGRWFYQTDMAFDTAENVPDKQEAIRIANAFIENNKLYPMDSLGEPIAVADQSGDGIFEPQTTLRWNIFYYPTVGGKPVYGVFRICIAVGANGEIVGVEKLANEYEKVTDVPLITAQQVSEEVAADRFMYMGEDNLKQRTLSEVQISMYADVESDFIQPVYEISNSDGSARILIDAQYRSREKDSIQQNRFSLENDS